MMKTLAWITSILVVIAAGVVGIVIPNQFHKVIHKEILAKNDFKGAGRVYKKLNYHTHLTTLSTEEFETKIITVSAFNPLDNHLLVNVRSKGSNRNIDFKIFGKITEAIEIHFQFQDFHYEGPDGKTSIKSPSIVMTTPLSENLLYPDKRVAQLMSNTLIKFNVGEVNLGWLPDVESTEQNSVKINELSLSVATSTNPQQNIKLTNLIEIKEWSVATNEMKDTFKNFHQSLVFDSFSQKGFKDNYLQITDQVTKKDGLPFQAKLLPMLGNLSSLITSPFHFIYTAKVDQTAGQSNFELKLSLADLAKGFMDAISASLNASIPKEVFEKQFLDFLSEKLTAKYHEEYYGTPEPPDQLAIPAINPANEDREKLKVTFKNFLNQDVDGKKNLSLAIQKSMEQGFLDEKEGFYLIKASFADKKVLINDKEFSSFAMPEFIEPQKITDYMLANGFQSRTLDKQKEWLLYEDPKLLKSYKDQTLLFAKKNPKKEVLCRANWKELTGPQSQTGSFKALDKGGLVCLNWCKDLLQQKNILVNALSHREGIKCFSDDIIQAFN